jgi:hypothetical protein
VTDYGNRQYDGECRKRCMPKVIVHVAPYVVRCSSIIPFSLSHFMSLCTFPTHPA